MNALQSLQLDINTSESINHWKKARKAFKKLTKSPQHSQRLSVMNKFIADKQQAYFQYYQWIRGFKWGIKKMPKVKRYAIIR